MKRKILTAVLASLTVLAGSLSAGAEMMPEITETLEEGTVAEEDLTSVLEEIQTSEDASGLTCILPEAGESMPGAVRTDIDTPDLDEKLFNKSTTVIYRLTDAGSGNLTIYWRYRTDVDGFQLRYSTDSSFTKDVHFAYYSGRNHATRYDLEVGKTYYVTVRSVMYNSGTRYNSNWSGTKSITLTRTLPGTTLKYARGTEKGLSAAWNKNPAVQGYQLMYADNRDFSGAKTATVKGGDKSSFTKTAINGKESWYVRIRTWRIAEDGEKYYSPWSEAAFVPAWK